MQRRMSAFYDKLIPIASAARGASDDIQELKAEAKELKQYTELYLEAQFTMQLISTAALVGVFLITLKAAQKRGK
jgi:hypothetical protein